MASLISRRGLLQSSLQLTLAGTIAAAAAGIAAADTAPASCADSKMDPGLASSLHYSEKSPDATKTCSGCGLFTAAKDGCGACMIFSATVNPKGHCDSWSAKG